jgi:hypothetical protein
MRGARERPAAAGGIMIDMIATTGRTMQGSIETALRIDCIGRTGGIGAVAPVGIVEIVEIGAFIWPGEVGDVPGR